MSAMPIDLKRAEVEDALCELERIIADAELAYEKAVSKWHGDCTLLSCEEESDR